MSVVDAEGMKSMHLKEVCGFSSKVKLNFPLMPHDVTVDKMF